MANPVVTPCAADTWVKVATNVTSIRVLILDFSPTQYVWTYRDTTGAAPTDQSESVPFADSLEATFSAGADVYVYAKSQAGAVRVDAP